VALTGRFFSAEEAHRAGLIARVCGKGEHIAVAGELARSIANNPPLSVRSTVRTRRHFMDRFERDIAAQTDPLKLYLTEDFDEAVNAHLEKRPAGPFPWALIVVLRADRSSLSAPPARESETRYGSPRVPS
jgi:enoyl-CoA hydratase/carnithine racemase